MLLLLLIRFGGGIGISYYSVMTMFGEEEERVEVGSWTPMATQEPPAYLEV
jgi:hypothetical protein